MYDTRCLAIIGPWFLRVFSLPVSFENKSVNSDFIIDTEEQFYVNPASRFRHGLSDNSFTVSCERVLDNNFKRIDGVFGLTNINIYSRLRLSFQERPDPPSHVKWDTLYSQSSLPKQPLIRRSTVSGGGVNGQRLRGKRAYECGLKVTRRRQSHSRRNSSDGRFSKKKHCNVLLRSKMNHMYRSTNCCSQRKRKLRSLRKIRCN